MPWCPRCDETFPEGPACPRCSARLVARERETHEDTLHTVPGLRQVKVSRRYLRAFERLSAPKPSSSRALAFALVLLVFATGFLLGRVGSVQTSEPVVRALQASDPIAIEDVKGSVAYVVTSRDRLMTIVTHDLYSGDVQPNTRLSSPPLDGDDDVSTRLMSFGRSAAVVLTEGRHGWVALAPHARASQGWLPASQAAWASESQLVVRGADGSLLQVQPGDTTLSTDDLGHADELFQTAAGAVVRRGRTLSTVNLPKRKLKLPERGHVLAVSPDLSHAILDHTAPVLWDGEKSRPVHAYEMGRVIGASYEPSGEHAAVLLADSDELTLAIVQPRGNAAFRPLGDAEPCDTAPAWDATGRWIYVTTSDGMLHAIEASGGRIESVRTEAVGCGMAWLDLA